jgi:hypothetical protein
VQVCGKQPGCSHTAMHILEVQLLHQPVLSQDNACPTLLCSLRKCISKRRQPHRSARCIHNECVCC